MIRIKEYKCKNGIPSSDEIKRGIDISNSSKCLVRINWFFPYSGQYYLDILPGMTYEDCMAELPKVYPV